MGFRLGTRLLALCLVAAAVAAGAAARAQLVSPDEVPLAEVLDVLLVDRDLLAISARRGGQVSERLGLDESVLWLGARGKVGVAITTRRILAVATGSGSWQETSYLRGERPPPAPTLGDRVALVLTDRRALGVDGGSGNLVEYRLGPKERLLASQVGANVAVFVTERSALGLSPLKGGFFPVKLSVAERIESIDAGANLATLTTDRRVLIFRTPTGTWEERTHNLN
jgi:hypothetical protein